MPVLRKHIVEIEISKLIEEFGLVSVLSYIAMYSAWEAGWNSSDNKIVSEEWRKLSVKFGNLARRLHKEAVVI